MPQSSVEFVGEWNLTSTTTIYFFKVLMLQGFLFTLTILFFWVNFTLTIQKYHFGTFPIIYSLTYIDTAW